MPTFLDGQQNLSSLTVPGVFADVILPTPLLLGTPTNIEGLVGVGSWGPTNALIPATQSSDAALSIGVPQIRTYDIASHIAAATQVGGAIGFLCVRVTDGTDTAASGIINPVAATQATGTIALPTNPTNMQTLTLGGTTVTFVTSGATGNEVNIGGAAATTVASLLSLLQASADTNISKCTYAAGSPSTTINVTYATGGTAGNSFAMSTTVTGGVVSADLSGGAAAT